MRVGSPFTVKFEAQKSASKEGRVLHFRAAA